MAPMIDDLRDRIGAFGRGVAHETDQRVEEGSSYLSALTRKATKQTDRGARALNDWTRQTAQMADGGVDYALDKVKNGRVSWGVAAGALGLGFVTAFALLNSKRAAVSATTALAGDWADVLTSERRRIERLFRQIAATRDSQGARRARLLDVLSAALTKHALQKENVIYPALRASDQGASSTHLAAEQFEIKTYLYELAALPSDDPRWMRKLKALQKLVEEHMQEEEEVVFPPFRQNLSESETNRLTRAMNREAAKLI